MELYVKICCWSLQIVKNPVTLSVLCFWDLIYCVFVAGGEGFTHRVAAVNPPHFHRSSGPWMDRHGQDVQTTLKNNTGGVYM